MSRTIPVEGVLHPRASEPAGQPPKPKQNSPCLCEGVAGRMVRYGFIKIRVKVVIFIKKFFIKNHFHQKPLSSKTTFTKTMFIRTTFIKIQFHQHFFFIKNHFHQKPFSSEKMKRKGGTVSTVRVNIVKQHSGRSEIGNSPVMGVDLTRGPGILCTVFVELELVVHQLINGGRWSRQMMNHCWRSLSRRFNQSQGRCKRGWTVVGHATTSGRNVRPRLRVQSVCQRPSSMRRGIRIPALCVDSVCKFACEVGFGFTNHSRCFGGGFGGGCK